MRIIILLTLILNTYIQAEIKPIFQIGIDLPIVKNPTKSIEIDSGYTAEGGIVFDTYKAMPNFTTELLLGYKIDTYFQEHKAVEKPIKIKLKRFIISAIESYNYNDFSFGLGASYHLSPKASYSYLYKNKMRNVERTFDSTLAGVVQLGYKVNENFDIKLRTTISKYSITVKSKKKTYFRSYNTSSLGLFLSYSF